MIVKSAAVAAIALSLVACSKTDGEGTTVSINGGNGTALIDGDSGEVKVDTPLFKGAIKLPKITMTADNFDLNGVHLYPGSKIGSVNVDAGKDGGEGSDGVVRVRFDSPASAEKVREWFRSEFEKAGTSVTVNGNSLSGQAEDERFRIDLQPAGERVNGVVTING